MTQSEELATTPCPLTKISQPTAPPAGSAPDIGAQYLGRINTNNTNTCWRLTQGQ